MPENHRFVTFHQTGDASVLALSEQPIQSPKQGELRLKVAAIGLNRAEIMFREGQYLEAPQFPAKIGYEASGIVEAIGEGVEGFAIGDKVSTIPAFSMNSYGVYGERVVVPAKAVAHYPSHLTAAEATSIWMQYITAWGALIHLGKLNKEQSVLITAASSSVGIAAIQIAKAVGATVIASTTSPHKANLVAGFGADHVVAGDQNLAENVLKLTHTKGVNVVFDPIGGPILNSLAEAAAQRAMIIEYGALSSEASPYPLFQSLAKALTIRGYTLFEITSSDDLLAQAKAFVTNMIEKQNIKPVIDKTFPFEAFQEAYSYMASNQHIGKIVVEV